MSSVMVKVGNLKTGKGLTMSMGPTGEVTLTPDVQAIMEHTFTKEADGAETFTFNKTTLKVDGFQNASVWMTNEQGTSMTFVQPDLEEDANGNLIVDLTGFPAGSYVLRFTNGGTEELA